MGTRGLLAFAHGGEIKATYNHFDSYPSYLGARVAEFVRNMDPEAVEKFERLLAVEEDGVPTEDQKLALLKYYNPKVSTGKADEWYALLRDTQGDPQAFLDAGFYIDSVAFALDSLFCEWGYVIDLDAEVVEIYKGFQTAPHGEGRFASEEFMKPYPGASPYYPIKLVHTVSFATLQLEPDYMGDALEAALSPDE